MTSEIEVAEVEESEIDTDSWEYLDRLTKDLLNASRLMGQREARWLVNRYYQSQKLRLQSSNQVRASEGREPNRVLKWIESSMLTIENDIKRSLKVYADEYAIGRWLQSITGIGPVITAGLLAHLDIRKRPTAGHFWRFAGLDPSLTWKKGEIRPWNANLKTLLWKASESFVKFQNNKRDFYGKLYVARKSYETDKNEKGHNAEAAKACLKKNFRSDSAAKQIYETGKLPPGHIHARAERWVAKLFLSHVHHAMYVDYYGIEPPKPYSFEKCQGDHRHFVELPNWPYNGGGKPLCELLDRSDVNQSHDS